MQDILGCRLDRWYIHTGGDRCWAISDTANLYAQELFPSLDYTISFQVGVATRIAAQTLAAASDEDEDLLPSAWRR